MLLKLIEDKPGLEPLRAAMRALKWHLVFAAGFSALVNILYLAPTIYMMQVYDRVVPTGGIMTLVFITAVVFFALATLGALDYLRGRILALAGLRLDRMLAGTVLRRVAGSRQISGRAAQALREFDQVRSAVGGQGMIALFDAPWTPIYLAVCFMLHPALGALALAGSLLLLTLAILNERASKPRLQQASKAAAAAYAAQETVASQAEVVRALGMRDSLVEHQLEQRRIATDAQLDAQLTGQGYTGIIKFLRLLLQSLALGLGAFLAVKGQISVGAIIAASVLLSRSVAPIEALVGAWAGIVQARTSWGVLTELFAGTADQDRDRTTLPKPAGRLKVENVSVRSPAGDAMLLKQIAFNLEPGQTLGVIGPSGAGKTTLARVIAGALAPDAGVIRLDGADYAAWDSEKLARNIGYLPQDALLFAGSIKQNISRFDRGEGISPDVLDARTVGAAKAAGVHEMILRLPQGYDTVLGPGGRGLSAGQSQRVALARALYGEPALMIFDEPNSHLDMEGEAALMRAIKSASQRGATVIVVAHRTGVLQALDLLLVLKDGMVQGFGPRDEVTARLQQRSERLRVAEVKPQQ